MRGSLSSWVERALDELQNIQQIVSCETSLAVLTTAGLVYQLSLTSDSQVCRILLQGSASDQV